MKFLIKTLIFTYTLFFCSYYSFAQINVDENLINEFIESNCLILNMPNESSFADSEVLDGKLDGKFVKFNEEFVSGQKSFNWIKIEMRNVSAKDFKFYLGTTRFEDIYLWQKTDSLTNGPLHSGLNVGINDRAVQLEGLSFFNIRIPANKTSVLYLKAINQSAPIIPQQVIPLLICSENYFQNNYQKQGDYTFFFLGAFIIMLFFNLLLYISTNIRLYIYLTCYILFVALFALGLIPEFAFPLYGHMDVNLIPISTAGIISTVFFVLMAQELMEIKKYYPRVHRYLNILLLVYAGNLILNIFPKLVLLTSIINFLTAFQIYPILIFISVNLVLRKHKPSVFFFIANLFFFAGVTVLLLSLTKVISPVIFGIPGVTFYQVGLMAQMSLFSLGIGNRINEMKHLKNQEEIERLRADQLVKEKEQTRNLLLNTLPESTVDELIQNGKVKPRSYENVTILFMDIVSFTNHVEKLSPSELIERLDYYYKKFDEINTKYHIEKIKTIGDAYLAVCGIPEDVESHAINVARASIEIMEFINTEIARNGDNFNLRIGIHTGSVIAGLVGITKFAYDIWGDAVNIAARMEQNSDPGKINLSESTYLMVKDQFNCIHRGKIQAKNKGKIDMYYLETNILV